MEPHYQTVAQMYVRLRSMVRQRGATGFRRAVAETALQARNPFEPQKKRLPKPGVSIAISVLLVLALVFVFFSLVSR